MSNVIKITLKFVIYLLVTSFILFILLEQTTGNPAVQYLHERGVSQITESQMKMAQEQLGLNGNIILRYFQWVGNALTGDFGTSFSNKEPVWDRIVQGSVPTIKLILGSAVILFPIGYVVGYLCGNHSQSKWSKFVLKGAQVVTSLPEYWLAIIFIYYFGVRWHLLPFVGSDDWRYFILPIVIIVLVEGSHLTLLSSHLFETSIHNQAFQLARLRQFKLKDKIFVQIKTVLAPLLTISINNFIHLFSRVIILEVIFSISGLGKLLINSINLRDYPMIQGILMCIIFMIMVLNYIGDLLLNRSDPRIRMTKEKGGRVAYED